MNPLHTKRSLQHLSERKVPVFLWGPPGIGKSSIVAQIAKEKDIGFIDLRLSLLDPTDLRGIPFFDAKNQAAGRLQGCEAGSPDHTLRLFVRGLQLCPVGQGGIDLQAGTLHRDLQ